MVATDFVYRPDMTSRAATGCHPRFSVSTPLLRVMTPAGIFDHRVGKFWVLSRFCVQGAPYGGLIGPVSEAARFLDLHLDPGAHPGVLSETAVMAMQRTIARGRKLDVGLGWFRRHRDPRASGHYWEHLGGGGGFFNTMRIYQNSSSASSQWATPRTADHLRLLEAATQGAGA